MMNEILYTMYKALDDKFGMDIVVLDINEISVIADYFIIATGNNKSQIQAMADELLRKAKDCGLTVKHVEGFDSANWILLDFGDVIVHIFDKENRPFYNLERIWRDAKTVEIDSTKMSDK